MPMLPCSMNSQNVTGTRKIREKLLTKWIEVVLFFLFLSLYTATRPRGHSRQVGAASVSIRQKKLKYSKE